jgi:signal transduction histidine kinase
MATEVPAATDAATDAAAELAQLRAHVAQTAHDLSNALGAVLNYATFLSEDLQTAEAAREYLPYLESAARRALQLVDHLAE